jgi:hypothetical protein
VGMEVVIPICRIVNRSKYKFTSCKIIGDNLLAVGRNEFVVNLQY